MGQNENPRTRLVAVQIVARAAADAHGGAVSALDAMQYLSAVAKERTRYQTIVEQLDDPACSTEYAAAVLHLVTNIINRAQVKKKAYPVADEGVGEAILISISYIHLSLLPSRFAACTVAPHGHNEGSQYARLPADGF